METNLDQKQLLILGYLRELLNNSNLFEYQLGFDGDDYEKTIVNAADSPALELSPFSKFDQHIQLFNFGEIPEFTLPPPATGINSVPSQYHNFRLPLNVIQFVYLYFNRFQNYLLLMGGSEDCKENRYNEIQIINLRNISDIKQNMEYPYTNYRLNPILWRERINYTPYFNKSIGKYLSAESNVVSTAMPITIIPEEEGKKQPIKALIITQSETNQSHSPWSAVNSPYSPFAKIAGNNNNNM
eukprot:UN01975